MKEDIWVFCRSHMRFCPLPICDLRSVPLTFLYLGNPHNSCISLGCGRELQFLALCIAIPSVAFSSKRKPKMFKLEFSFGKAII